MKWEAKGAGQDFGYRLLSSGGLLFRKDAKA